MKKNCVICDAEFEARGRSHNRNTCGEECKRLNRNKRAKKWRNSPKGKAYVKQHRKEYAERAKLNQRKKMQENREEYNRKHREYIANKRAIDPEFDERMRKASSLYMNKRLKEDTQFRLNQNIATAVRATLRTRKITKRNRTYGLLGYTGKELKEHLESQFTDGMSWDNMGEWHIDHIRPVSSFDYDSTDHPDFKKCWALNNLQPLWAKDNLSKGDKWDGVVNA